jgi:hypothetical protein
LAEEKEEDGGQRRPEKRKEPLGKTAPTLPFGGEEDGQSVILM